MATEKEIKRFKDDHTQKRIHEHLRNQNDRISDEDISNVKTDIAKDGNPDEVYRENDRSLLKNPLLTNKDFP